MAGAVRVVLDGRHARRNAELVPPEVDPAVAPLVPAAAPARRDVSLVVAPARLLERLEQRPLGLRLRDLGEVRDRAKARRRGDRFELSDAHISPRTPGSRRLLSASQSPSSRTTAGRRSDPGCAAWRARPWCGRP